MDAMEALLSQLTATTLGNHNLQAPAQVMAKNDPMSREALDQIRLTTQGGGATGFDPQTLRPAAPPTPVYAGGTGVGSGDSGGLSADQGMTYTKQEMVGPNGQTYVKLTAPNGEHSYTFTDQNGQLMKVSQGPDGSWKPRPWEKNGLFKTVFGDKKLMTFLGVAGGVGALAASGALGATGGAGGAMLGGGTGATPGVVAGGTMGTPGLMGAVGAGAAAGAYDTAGLDQLIQDSEARDAARFAGQGGSNGFLDTIRQVFGDNVNVGDLIRNGGQLALMREMYESQKGNAQEWRNFMRETTPHKGFYEDLLKQTYQEPGSFLAGQEYQAAQGITHDKLQRSDAAGGRLANDIGRQKLLQDHAMNWLGNYRQNLGSIVGDQQRTSSGQGSGALSNAQNQETEWMRNMMNWISGMGQGGRQ